MVTLNPERVEKAMDDCRGRTAAFLDEHGFGWPRDYWVVNSNGRTGEVYPAKAVAAVALGWEDINGGYSKRDSACNLLERAGFIITDEGGVPIKSDAQALVREVERKCDELGSTEALALVKQRVGQEVFRAALLRRWKQCPMTGVDDPALLRASHMKPWAKCANDFERLDPNNGILLSAMWDAAFDAGLVTFGDDGRAIVSPLMSREAVVALRCEEGESIWFDDEHLPYLAWHRENCFVTDG